MTTAVKLPPAYIPEDWQTETPPPGWFRLHDGWLARQPDDIQRAKVVITLLDKGPRPLHVWMQGRLVLAGRTEHAQRFDALYAGDEADVPIVLVVGMAALGALVAWALLRYLVGVL